MTYTALYCKCLLPMERLNRLSKLSDRVQQLNSVARVLVCSYGQLPLHTVLDIEAPRTDVQGVSHEVRAERATGVFLFCDTKHFPLVHWSAFPQCESRAFHYVRRLFLIHI